jgi:hypothetical protein
MQLGWSTFVLERRVSVSLRAVEAVLVDDVTCVPGRPIALTDGWLLFDDRFRVASRPLVPGSRSWRTSARLLNGRTRSVASVELEVGVWSTRAAVLQVSPMARHPERWSRRRADRYYRLGHAGADQLLARLGRAGDPRPERGRMFVATAGGARQAGVAAW